MVVSEDDILDLVDQMRTAIPKEIKQAELVLRERDRRLAQAEEEAGRIVQMAHGEAQKLAEEHEVVHAANQRAQTILERAQRDAQTLKDEADEYARSVLLDLNEQLEVLNEQIGRVLTTIHNGLRALSAEAPAETE